MLHRFVHSFEIAYTLKQILFFFFFPPAEQKSGNYDWLVRLLWMQDSVYITGCYIWSQMVFKTDFFFYTVFHVIKTDFLSLVLLMWFYLPALRWFLFCVRLVPVPVPLHVASFSNKRRLLLYLSFYLNSFHFFKCLDWSSFCLRFSNVGLLNTP